MKLKLNNYFYIFKKRKKKDLTHVHANKNNNKKTIKKTLNFYQTKHCKY